MIYQTNKKRGAFVDFVLKNYIYTTPKQCREDQLYSVGEHEAFITIQCDKRGQPVSARVIKYEKINKVYTPKFYRITNQDDARFISGVCKKKIIGQKNEALRINSQKTR